MMKENPLLKIQTIGQSIWLDLLRRGMLSSGELQQLIKEDGLRGVTSNPAIFEKAIAGSHDYDDAIRTMALANKSVEEIYQALTVDDVQRAADLFRPVYDQTQGRDGFVSLEVSPHLAYDSDRTILEARRLWAALDRPNVLIKVPATWEGLPAIQQLTCEGINVNVTLLFSLGRYQEVAEAYIAGLEAGAALGRPLGRLTSVASFFLSRIDVLVDSLLEKVMRAGGARTEMAGALRGHAAIASAKVAYQMYREIFASERFRKLTARGARTQRLLWASTGTKNPAYSDVKYVEALIGPETVNTMPLETLNAYRDHGNPAPRLEEAVEEARCILAQLPEAGIDLEAVTQQLEKEGVQKFIVPFDRLMATLEEKCGAALREPLDRQTLDLGAYQAVVRERAASLEKARFSARLWRKDPTLWKTEAESQAVIRNALGWLHLAEKMEDQLDVLHDFVAEVQAAGLRYVVHMGMGGSSLAPLVFQRIFTPARDSLPLTILDTTDPVTILKIEREVPIVDTLYIVASKSGTTAETLAFRDYFYAKVKAIKGDRTGENFVAITDPGTPLADLARQQGFRRIFFNFPDIGGRYSSLSHFGLVPAALIGISIAELLARALRMMHACTASVPVQDNPGVVLGAMIGELARHGRDKVTLLAPEPIAPLGMWVEQLLAESTGKEGTGLLPVAGEPLSGPSMYGEDRLFVHIRLRDDINDAFDRSVYALREMGQPVVTMMMDDRLDIGQEFFRWELAAATAGAILEINPFDQPNVQESKDNTNRLLEELRQTGKLPEPTPTLSEGPLRFYAPERAKSARNLLRSFFAQVRRGDYVSLQAYLTETTETNLSLQAIRLLLRDSLHVATTLGYGPRFLHSTGQFHKGGPNIGLFLQLTADDVEDAPIPGAPYTFGTFKRAQALGDLDTLRKHGRRVVRVHLGTDVAQGLAVLEQILETALAGGAG
jgi:transaldolase/glucose-6-phosphate isomerase